MANIHVMESMFVVWRLMLSASLDEIQQLGSRLPENTCEWLSRLKLTVADITDGLSGLG